MARFRILLQGLLLYISCSPLTVHAHATSDGIDPRTAWFQQTVQQSRPVREQLAMLSRTDSPLTIRIYRGSTLAGNSRTPLLARLDDQELSLSEGLLDALSQLEQSRDPRAARWTLLYVLGYLGARHPDLQQRDASTTQQTAMAMLSAINLVLASAWNDDGRPSSGALQPERLQQVLRQIAYTRDIPWTGLALRTDADGFIADMRNARLLAVALENDNGSATAGLE